jgi:hypothetical protein
MDWRVRSSSCHCHYPRNANKQDTIHTIRACETLSSNVKSKLLKGGAYASGFELLGMFGLRTSYIVRVTLCRC